MKEQYSPEQPRKSMEEYRLDFFEKMEKDTRVFSDDEYQKLYVVAKEHWGIDSPAFIVPKHLLDRHPNPEVVPADIAESLIAINGDSVPEPRFINYLKTHEHWECYITKKEGFGLGKHDRDDYQLPILERKRPGHRYATFKEFQAAEKDGKLDEYMEWWRNFYQADIEQVMAMPEEEIKRISKNYGKDGGDRDMIIKFIKKNLEIKESIYKKMHN